MGLFSKFRKKKEKDTSMENAINNFFALKDQKYSTPSKTEFFNDKSDLNDYLNEKISSNAMTTKDYFAQDALNNQAYSKLVQALQKELSSGDIRLTGKSNVEWSNLAKYVMTTVPINNYYNKNVRVTLGINCENEVGDAITVDVEGDHANIRLDAIPDNDADASFIYENTAKKVRDYLVSKGYNRYTF